LLMVDTAKVDIAVAAWVASKTIPNGCKRDPLSPDTLECDEAAFLKPDTSVRIGNFATNMATQDFGNGAYRFVVPVRGDPSITWVDGNASTLTCTSGDTAFALCDDNHRLTTVQNDDSIGILGDEPYGVYADSQAGYAVIAHLTTGALTLIDSTLNQGAQIADIQTGIFASDSTGLRGATAVAGRTPGAVDGLVYAVSRSEDRVEMLTVARQTGNNAPFLLPSGYFFLDSVGNTSGGSSDSRGLAFSQNGDRLFVLNRRPTTRHSMSLAYHATKASVLPMFVAMLLDSRSPMSAMVTVPSYRALLKAVLLWLILEEEPPSLQSLMSDAARTRWQCLRFIRNYSSAIFLKTRLPSLISDLEFYRAIEW
jgi:hypothetical protein